MSAWIGFLGLAYPWVKAAHVAFVIFWMAGLFMLPRFLVYHQEAVRGSRDETLWSVREKRLVTIILNPAIVMVWLLGLALVVNIGAGSQTWFHLKFAVVTGLSFYHFWMVRYVERLATAAPRVTGRTLRLLNEVPSIATILIVILVIVKPFGN